MTGSIRNGCNGLQRLVVAHVHKSFAPQAATGATPPIGALPVAPACVGAAPFVGKVSATKRKPPRGMRASRNGKWLLTSIHSSALSTVAASLEVARPDGRPVRLARSRPALLARQALGISCPSSDTLTEIAREQAKRLADRYITRSGELVMPLQVPSTRAG
jgi:hypothetical protein